jgi:putative FmdB family regulatory protein
MPTYSYLCDACNRGFEVEQRISDPPLKKCPKCGKSKARRMISNSGNFILKGGGWYSDGYGSSKKNGSRKSESSSSSKDSSSKAADTSSDSSSSKDKTASTSKDSSSSKDAKPAPSSGSSSS